MSADGNAVPPGEPDREAAETPRTVTVPGDSGREVTGGHAQAEDRPGAPEREARGRLVHAERLKASDEPPGPFLLEAWERRTEAQRELDMRIGEAVAAAERGRLRGILIRFAAEAARGKWAYGLPEEPAFEALRRIAVDLKKAADGLAIINPEGGKPS